jgi:hypothetical protein
MPNFNLSNQPRFEIVTIDTDNPITEDVLLRAFGNRTGITLCLRTATGHPNRGGHFFCIQNVFDKGLISLETIEGEYVDSFTVPNIVRFINHAAGLEFDSEMQLYCQNNINFRND